jgi:arginyl-tRNA synthetase
MNIFKDLKNKLGKIILDIAQDSQIIFDEKKLNIFTVEPCKDKNHGDIATNIAMVFSKDFKKKPYDLASCIIDLLAKNEDIESVKIAGAGFINIIFKKQVWCDFLNDLLAKKEFEFPDLGKKEKINLEYASPNPTGPMHVGHTRGAIYGDVLANLLIKTNFDVTKEYYINDAGSQIITLVKSAYLRYLESCGQKIEITEGLYPGEYLIAIGQKIKEKYQDSLINKEESEYIDLIRDFVVDEMMSMIKDDLLQLGISHDVFSSEKKKLHDSGKIDQAIKILEDKGLIYQGTLEPPKNRELSEEYSNQEQTLFKSTLFGDDVDRVVRKSDGLPTYLAGDIAYSLDKFERGFKKMILPLGFDHAGYVKRLTGVVKAISNNEAEVKVILCQMVKFLKDGQPLKMSKRSGNFITAREVVDEVGADVLRFTMLTRKNDAPFNFDLAKMLEQSKDNPIFYIQYAYARCSSVIRNLKNENPELAKLIDVKINNDVLNRLNNEIEIDLIKKLANYERVIEMSVINFEPHRIAFYLQELAANFHFLWNEGKNNGNLRFIIEGDDELTRARLLLIISIMKIISSALSIFNIKPMEEM